PAMPLGNQYGAFGALVGHELSHAVDGLGRHVDADGNVRDWWTPEDAARWEAMANRVGRFYAGLPYPGLAGTKVDGTLTRDEDVADLAGVTLARAALAAAKPELDAQIEKGFYTGWAQLWAQQVTADEARLRARQDVRAPGLWRANAPAMQRPDFGKAFDCKAGAPMLVKDAERIQPY
ncbi:M13-type metalloendopeptidase, partial [Thermomonas sp.]|uniref:M13-type metalloendopeptidase n=1 Tax=Thermomonas sp. TaxID=1971895 RepID=UPI003D11C314